MGANRTQVTFADMQDQDVQPAGLSLITDGVGGITTSGIAGGSTPIFGTELNYADDDTESSSTSSIFAQKLRLTASGLPAGDYLLEWSAETQISGGGSQESRMEQDDTTELGFHKIDGSQNDNYQNMSGLKKLTLSGTHTFDIDHRRSSGSGTALIRRARIILYRLT